MRHRVRGRILGRTSSHRKAMFRNMAVSLIRSVRVDPDDLGAPKFPGRITTTTAKAKELRPFVEKLVTMARKALPLQREADELATSAEKNSAEWRQWRESDKWNEWNQAQAPVLALRRRAFSMLRDNEAVDVLFTDIAERFEDRPGGYTRVVKLATRRLGDGGEQSIIEFVGERDRVKVARSAPVVADEEETQEEAVAEEPAGEEAAASQEETAEASSEEGSADEEKKDGE
ncbi:bL17 family ribosomal protein [Rubinisphaera sp. JC750]|uniref:bL17 family ribosomal protein n=1 Tax=Rubinisphaera sp. JC750 TaxID=2898658 RepID=UPI001F1B73BF|nr:50S ribosomal protein L17 [Rubinisphaera sp. JC750]